MANSVEKLVSNAGPPAIRGTGLSGFEFVSMIESFAKLLRAFSRRLEVHCLYAWHQSLCHASQVLSGCRQQELESLHRTWLTHAVLCPCHVIAGHHRP